MPSHIYWKNKAAISLIILTNNKTDYALVIL